MYLRTKFVVHPLLWKFFPSLSLLASSRAITAIVALHITLAAFCLWFKCQCFSDHLWSARSVVSCHIMAGNFMEPSKLLLSNIILSEPESSILWAGCVDPPPPTPKKPKPLIEGVKVGWVLSPSNASSVPIDTLTTGQIYSNTS